VASRDEKMAAKRGTQATDECRRLRLLRRADGTIMMHRDTRMDSPPTADITAAPLRCTVNGRERTFPLTRVDPEQFRELRRAAHLLDRRGGLQATCLGVTTSLVKIAFLGLEDSEQALRRGREIAAVLLRLARHAAPEALPAGCTLALEQRTHGPQQLLVSLYVERPDTFDVVERAARTIAPELARQLGTSASLSFLIGAAEQRRVRVLGRVGLKTLFAGIASPPKDRAGAARLRDALERVLARHVHDRHTPELALEHNARVLSGSAAASAIFGAATDFLQLEGQIHAARSGGCDPLVRWTRADTEFAAELEVPIRLQRAPGVLNAREIEAACSVAEVDDTQALELACASVGLVASVAGLQSDLRASVRGASAPRAWERWSLEASLPAATADR
jgi:hypothetical protein